MKCAYLAYNFYNLQRGSCRFAENPSKTNTEGPLRACQSIVFFNSCHYSRKVDPI